MSLWVRLADLAVLSAAFPAAYLVRDNMERRSLAPLNPIATYWPVLVLTLLLWIGVSWATRVYEVQGRRPLVTEAWRLVRGMGLVAWAMFALGGVTHEHDVSRLFVALYFVLGLLLLLVDRLAIRLLARWRGHGFNARRFAVVGCEGTARDVVRCIARKAKWGYEFAGFVADGEAPPPLAPRKILGSFDELPRLLETNVLDEVIFAMRRDRLDAIESGVRLCEERGISSWVCLDFIGPRIASVAVDDSLGIPMLAFTTTPLDAAALAAKRALDVVISAAALVLLAPILAIAAAAIAIDSPGPILFRQRRVGTNGRVFWFYKFRSMRQDAEKELPRLMALNEATGPVFKMRKDPRITRVGALLRRTSIDELPQLWNVLRGEMSIVGPRPPLPGEVQRYASWQRRRLSIRPGITCTWQVSGRSQISFEDWMTLDLRYIDTWSLWQDLKILARTVPAVVTGRGAH